MLNNPNQKRVTIDFPTELYRLVKTFAAYNDLSIRDFVVKAVNNELKINIPNDETLETFKKTDKGEELNKHASFKALLASMKKKGELK